MGDSRSSTPVVNDFIDRLDFPTRFDMAPKMAEVVSFTSSVPFPSSLSFSGATPLLCQSLGCGPRTVRHRSHPTMGVDGSFFTRYGTFSSRALQPSVADTR
jgi:hypothetical protein